MISITCFYRRMATASLFDTISFQENINRLPTGILHQRFFTLYSQYIRASCSIFGSNNLLISEALYFIEYSDANSFD